MSKLAVLWIALALPLGAAAHGDAERAAKPDPAPVPVEEKAFGRAGDPARVDRTVEISMDDRMRYRPSVIRVRQGETIRFRVRNEGKVLHEVVLGTLDELKEHAELMRKHPGMEHDEPHMAHVRAGGRQDLVWQFTQPGEVHFGCLMPGHFEAGMLGKVLVSRN